MRLPPSLLALALALPLAGCGGGVWLGVCDGCDDEWDDPPSVSLAVAPAQARAGETVRLAAAASDDFAVREVEFYRLDALGNAVFLATDTTAPYEVDVVQPGDSGSPVRYFARAVDDRRQRTDSATAAVGVLP